MFHVGQEVECVSSRYRSGRLAPPFLTVGRRFVIRGFTVTPRGNQIIHLAGYVGPKNRNGYEKGFRPEMFRPIVDRKTDISVFTEMLKPQHVDA